MDSFSGRRGFNTARNNPQSHDWLKTYSHVKVKKEHIIVVVW